MVHKFLIIDIYSSDQNYIILITTVINTKICKSEILFQDVEIVCNIQLKRKNEVFKRENLCFLMLLSDFVHNILKKIDLGNYSVNKSIFL